MAFFLFGKNRSKLSPAKDAWGFSLVQISSFLLRCIDRDDVWGGGLSRKNGMCDLEYVEARRAGG